MVVEAVIALVSIILSTAISEAQTKSQEQRNARETFVRSLYQAVQDRYNISINQLDQMAERLGFNLSQLAESSRNSARLSTATQKYLKYLQDYPKKVDSINRIKNTINNEINNLETIESKRAATIQQRGTVENKEILTDLSDSVNKVRSASQDAGMIDTNVTTKPIEEKLEGQKKQEIETTLRNHMW